MRVGTSFYVSVVDARHKDHPHACGDKFLPMKACMQMSGSSPCVWGQVCTIFYCFIKSRIIPMRVGTSCTRFCNRAVARDHPHACGDK